MKWKVVGSAPQPIAEMWADLLQQAGIPAFIRPENLSGQLGQSKPMPVVVPEERLQEAKDTLAIYTEPHTIE